MFELKRLSFSLSKEENVVEVYGGRRGKSAHRVLMEWIIRCHRLGAERSPESVWRDKWQISYRESNARCLFRKPLLIEVP